MPILPMSDLYTVIQQALLTHLRFSKILEVLMANSKVTHGAPDHTRLKRPRLDLMKLVGFWQLPGGLALYLLHGHASSSTLWTQSID